MSAIVLEAVSFSYGSRLVLDRVTLNVGPGERACLIGPNGAGKSTLLRVLAGELIPDAGRVLCEASSQPLPDPEICDGTVADFLELALAPIRDLTVEFERITEALAAGQQGLEAEYDRLLAQMNFHDVWSIDAHLDELLSGLGLPELADSAGQHASPGATGGDAPPLNNAKHRPMTALSPGQRARLRLAVVLLLRPPVLLLDEPTNHLDAKAIDFLAHALKQWEGPVVFASHDRAFIDEVATVIYDLDVTIWNELARADHGEVRGVHRNAGNYSDYLAGKATAEARYEHIYAAQQAEKHDLHEHRSNSTKIAQGGKRLKEAEGMAKKFFSDRAASTATRRTRNDDLRLERLAEQEVRKPREYRLTLPPLPPHQPTGLAVSARQASVHGRLAPISFDLAWGEHLLITGDNGAGKSTLLNWITTGAPPEEHSSGSISRGQTLAAVPQRLPASDDSGFEDGRWDTGIGALGRGILHPSLWNTPIPSLSAGNQRRAQIAVALASQPSILVIDEPTNYVDLATMQALETAFEHWQGTLIIASHDRWLIEHWQGRRLHIRPA